MIARLVTWAICGGFAAMFLVVGVREFVQQRRNLAHAEPVDAVILESRVHVSTTRDTDYSISRSTSTTSYRPDVRFAYTVRGESYESDRLQATVIVRAYASWQAADDELAPFPVGARVSAWVNPAYPDQGFLVAERSVAPAIFVVLGVLMPFIGWGVGRLF